MSIGYDKLRRLPFKDPWKIYPHGAPKVPSHVESRLRDELRAFERTAEFRTIRRELDLAGQRLVAWRKLALENARRRWGWETGGRHRFFAKFSPREVETPERAPDSERREPFGFVR